MEDGGKKEVRKGYCVLTNALVYELCTLRASSHHYSCDQIAVYLHRSTIFTIGNIHVSYVYVMCTIYNTSITMR